MAGPLWHGHQARPLHMHGPSAGPQRHSHTQAQRQADYDRERQQAQDDAGMNQDGPADGVQPYWDTPEPTAPQTFSLATPRLPRAGVNGHKGKGKGKEKGQDKGKGAGKGKTSPVPRWASRSSPASRPLACPQIQ